MNPTIFYMQAQCPNESNIVHQTREQEKWFRMFDRMIDRNQSCCTAMMFYGDVLLVLTGLYTHALPTVVKFG